jgi:hypothetical protein
MSALDNANQLLQNLAKVAELQSAQSDLPQIQNTIKILSGLRQNLAKITRDEVLRSKRDTDTRKANASARRVSMAPPPRNGGAHRPEKSVTGTPQPNGSHKTAGAASATLPARSTSVRANTGPRAELPGEAISRRKREAIDAKRRADEEEVRRKREFKARPAPHSSNSSNSHPRETISSRARQAKALLAENNAPSDAPSATNKRHSIAVQPLSRPPLAATTSSSATPGTTAGGTAPRSRGRDTAAAPILHSPALSRNASSSAGSAHGSGGPPRSTVSAEEAAQQKLRGRDIYVRDNSFSADRDRERREREEAARLARLDAAERSRQLSREWAEKQRVGGGGK